MKIILIKKSLSPNKENICQTALLIYQQEIILSWWNEQIQEFCGKEWDISLKSE